MQEENHVLETDKTEGHLKKVEKEVNLEIVGLFKEIPMWLDIGDEVWAAASWQCI